MNGPIIDVATSNIDQSVLGITHAELRDLSPDERDDYLRDALHRAADLSAELASAFSADLGTAAAAVRAASETLSRVARSE
jgi:hypothetical protein